MLILQLGLEDENDSDESSNEDLREEFRMYKAYFYKYKLDYDKVDRYNFISLGIQLCWVVAVWCLIDVYIFFFNFTF